MGILLTWAAGTAVLMVLSTQARQTGKTLPGLEEVIIGGLAFHGAGLLLVNRFLKRQQLSPAGAFGFGLAPRRAVLIGTAAGLGFLPVAYGVQWACTELLLKLGWEVPAQKTVELLLTDGSWTVRTAIAILAIAIAPVVEEALFRGVLFTTFRDLGWPRAAFWGTSVLFGLIHANAAAFVPLTLFGLLLAWLYEFTGNLKAPVAAHAVFNIAPFVLLAMDVDLHR